MITPLATMPALPDGDGPVQRHITLRLQPDDAKIFDAAIASAITGNPRSSANRNAALVWICQSFLDGVR